MTKSDLLLIGAGGHAHACIDVIEQHGGYRIAGLVGLPGQLKTSHLGYEVIGSDDDLPRLAESCRLALISVGQIKSPERRIRLYQIARGLGFQFPSVIAPSAHVSRHARIGPGTIVMHGAIVNAGAVVGANCIVNTRALVEHDAVVGDHCHISTGAILNGTVVIGTGSFVGSGSVVKEGVIVGKNCLVGMGLTLRHNLADQFRFVGIKS
jgi:sugar O-acyltransferase (sialic acid O-acetyltransferase NeuD family)